MPKVNQTISTTVNLGDYNSAKVEVSINEIDTEEDVDKQLEDAKAAINKAFPMVFKAVQAEVKKVRG